MFTTAIKKAILLASVGALIPLAPAHAQRVEPMRFELTPSGNNAQTTLEVTNTRSYPITVETVPSVLLIDKNGDETLTPADDDFLIFPPQAIIDAGTTQSFRVRYIGEGVLDTSKAYRIGINQLPIDLREDGESGVSVTVNFATLVNVVPEDVQSNLSVSELSADGDGRWRMLVQNNGDRYARMPDLDITVSQDGRTSEVSSSQTQGWFNKNLILPGGQLYVTMPAQDGYDPQRATIQLVESS